MNILWKWLGGDPVPFKDSLSGCVLPSAVFCVELQLMDWVPLGVGIHRYASLLLLCKKWGVGEWAAGACCVTMLS